MSEPCFCNRKSVFLLGNDSNSTGNSQNGSNHSNTGCIACRCVGNAVGRRGRSSGSGCGRRISLCSCRSCGLCSRGSGRSCCAVRFCGSAVRFCSIAFCVGFFSRFFFRCIACCDGIDCQGKTGICDFSFRIFLSLFFIGTECQIIDICLEIQAADSIRSGVQMSMLQYKYRHR